MYIYIYIHIHIYIYTYTYIFLPAAAVAAAVAAAAAHVYICLCVSMKERSRARAREYFCIMVWRWTCELKSYNTNKAFECNIYNLYKGAQRRCAEAAIRVGPNTNLNIETPHRLSRNLKSQQSKTPRLKKSQINSRQKDSKRTQRKNEDPRATGGLVATRPPPQVKKIQKHTSVWVIDLRFEFGSGAAAKLQVLDPPPAHLLLPLSSGPHSGVARNFGCYRIFVKAQKSLPNSEKTQILLGGSAHC